jgi:hypothetical protein
MTTIPALAARSGRNPRTIRKAITRLGIPKTGRDYLLSEEQAEMVLAEIKSGPGRPKKIR